MFQEAMLKLLSEKELAKISIADIAEISTLNRATFYLHYRDKYELLESTVAARFTQLVAERGITFEGCTGAIKKIALAVCYYLLEVQRPLDPSRAGFEAALEIAIVPVLKAVMLEGIQKHPQSKPVEPGLLASTMAWSIYGAAKESLSRQAPHDLDSIAQSIEQMVTPMLNG